MCPATATAAMKQRSPPSPPTKQWNAPLACPLPWYNPLCHQHIGSCCSPPPSGCCGGTGGRRGGSSSPHLRLQRDGQVDLLEARRPSHSAPSTGVFTLLASGSRSPEGTDAAEAVDLILAGGPVGTGGRLALVDICRGSRGIRSGSNMSACLCGVSEAVKLTGGSTIVPQRPHQHSPGQSSQRGA